MIEDDRADKHSDDEKEEPSQLEVDQEQAAKRLWHLRKREKEVEDEVAGTAERDDTE